MKVLEISKKDLKNNIDIIKNIMIGEERDDNGEKKQIIAVVKSNGMGIGLVEESKFLVENGITFLAVATIDEVLILANEKLNCKMLMLSPVSNENDIKILLDNKVTLTIGSMEELEKVERILEERNEEAECHIKIDTGLARYGFLYDDTEIIDCFEKVKRLKITGMFTHRSKPTDEKWTKKQFNRFLDVVAGVKASGYNPGLLHVASSTPALKYPEMRLNAVRIGSAFQGRTLVKGLGFKPVGVFKTNIEEIKTLPKGYNISYGNSYTTKRQTKVAILPVGYRDGLFMDKHRDTFSFIDNIVATLMEFKKIFKDNSLKVKINGNEYKVVGRVGMYHAVVDITGADDIKVGDEVVFNLPPLLVSDNIKREYN